MMTGILRLIEHGKNGKKIPVNLCVTGIFHGLVSAHALLIKGG